MISRDLARLNLRRNLRIIRLQSNGSGQGGKSALRANNATIMSDPAACAATTLVALTPLDSSQKKAAQVTPKKAKPPRLAGPRIKPFGDRIRTAEEVG